MSSKPDNKHYTVAQLQAYWEHRAPSYYIDDTFGRNVVRLFINKLKPESLIEIGCGNGELFSTYKEVPYVVGVDWCENMLKRARLRKERHYYPNLKLWRHDITKRAPAGKYEVALTRTVLMHIPPEAIEKTIRHIVKVAKQFLIFEYFEPSQIMPLSAHCFMHDYVPLFEKAGCKLVAAYPRPDQPQVMYHFKKIEG